MLIRCISGALVCAGFIAAAAWAQDLTMDQILKKNEDAIGGSEAISKVQTLKMTIRMLGGDGQSRGVMTVYLKRPNFVRSEATIEGTTVTSAFDGTTAWMINPFTGSSEPQKMDAAPASGRDANLDTTIGSLSSFKAAGQSVELLGKEDAMGVPAYKLKVTSKSGLASTYFLSAETFLPIKTLSKVSEMGPEMDVEGYPSNYRKVGDIMFAHSVEQKAGDRSLGQMIYEKIEINTPMDDSIFKMPIK